MSLEISQDGISMTRLERVMSPLDKSLLSNAPAIFVYEQGSWRATNSEADAIANVYDWISLRNGRLTFAHATTDGQFRQRVSETVSNHEGATTRRVHLIIRDVEGVPVGAVLLFREHWPSILGATGINPTLIFAIIVPEERRRIDQTRALVDFGGLTQAEGELIADLLAGRTVQAIADRTARSISTVRWHIRNILGKLGISRIDDLYRIAGLLP